MAIITENYTLDELKAWIRRKLGGAIWRLEGMSESDDVIEDGIGDALMRYNYYCPMVQVEMIENSGVQNGFDPISYSAGNVSPLYSSSYDLTNPGFGVWRVDFLDHLQILNGDLGRNLTGVQLIGAVGSGEVAQLLTQIKSYRRATTNDPHWYWDEDIQKLYIKANFERACVWTYVPRAFEKIRLVHKDFVKRFALEYCRKQLGINRRKFAGSVSGPGGTAIELDGQQLIDEADAALEKMEEELLSMTPRTIPVYD